MLVAWSCPTLCDPMDCSPPGSSVHGILQARRLKWVGIPFSRGSSWPRDQTRVSCIAGRFFTIWVTREARREGLQMSLYLRRLHYLPCLYCFAQTFFFLHWIYHFLMLYYMLILFSLLISASLSRAEPLKAICSVYLCLPGASAESVTEQVSTAVCRKE